MKSQKVFVLGIVLGFVLSSIAINCADEGVQTIQAFLNNSVKIKLNGQDWNPKDPATGEKYIPITYNGRTYLPVRAVVSEAASMPINFDTESNTVWIGGTSEILPAKDADIYEVYYGTIFTTDTQKLSNKLNVYKWGVTNDKDLTSQFFTFSLKAGGKYKNFRASFYIDGDVKDNVSVNIRKNNYNGEIIKTITLKPGETLSDVNVDVGGVEKICIESNIRDNVGVVKKVIVGEPTFYN